MRTYFESGVTRPYGFRKEKLLALRREVIRREQEIAEALHLDLKKNPEEAYGTETGLLLAEINMALKNLHRWMQPSRVATNLVNLPSTSRIYRDPLGVVLIIAPWNYPFQLSLIPLVGAIAGGNGAVVKPSEMAPATAEVIEKIISSIFEPAWVRVVQGDGATVVPQLMKSFRFDHIFYTGSIPVGRSIYQQAAADLVPVTLELGGKTPVIVEADADIPVAARRIAFGKFLNAGQTCIAPDYLLLHRSVRDRFLENFEKVVKNFYRSDAASSRDYGKIINQARFDKLVGYLSCGRILAGGEYDRPSLYIAPTVIDRVAPDAPVMKEEVFGPILPVFDFESDQDALSLIRQHPNPLSFYVFTSSRERERFWIGAVPFGNGCVNNTVWQFANHHLPFGGIATSGVGSYHGRFTFDTFTHPKAVMKTPVWPDPKVKYPPFLGKLRWFKLFIR
jgi:aldehyde dehydrogenase (NAD+)